MKYHRLSCRRFGVNLMAGRWVQFILGERSFMAILTRRDGIQLALTNLYCITICKILLINMCYINHILK